MTSQPKRSGAPKRRIVDKKLVGGIKTRLAHQKSSTKNQQRRRDIRNAKA